MEKKKMQVNVRLRNLKSCGLGYPVCEKCREETGKIGKNGQIILCACPRCNPEIFAELERMQNA